MKTIFLKFTNEDEANSMLFTSAVLDEEGNEITPKTANYPNIDIVGVITKQVSEEIFEALDGYHVNLAADSCPEELQQYEVFPMTPSRVFGGLE